MGQKVHPIGIRLGIVKDWSSKWYANSKEFPDYVKQDHEVRVYIKNKFKITLTTGVCPPACGSI